MFKSSTHHYSQNFYRRLAIVTFCFVFALLAVASEEDREYRHDVMEAIGYHASALQSIMEQKVPHKEHLAIHVNAIADLSTIVEDLFPAGSEGGESLPAIWEEPEKFQTAVDRFEVAAEELREVVKKGDTDSIPQKAIAMFRACKGCHDDYRE